MKKIVILFSFAFLLIFLSSCQVISGDVNIRDYISDSFNHFTADCKTCYDTKTVDCTNCDATGSVVCNICQGTMKKHCYICSNTNFVTCLNCSGMGFSYEYDFFSGRYEYKNCMFCVGGRKTCPSIHICFCGDGKMNCESCGADGKIVCPDCE